jgi:hypothetical protein
MTVLSIKLTNLVRFMSQPALVQQYCLIDWLGNLKPTTGLMLSLSSYQLSVIFVYSRNSLYY